MAWEPQLFGSEGWGRRPPPGLKAYLFTLNLQMDWLLDRIQMIRWGYDPIIFADGVTEIERLTIALEDRYFFKHSGIDWRFVPRVLRQLVTFKRVGGVSTIEQQLVRTILERRDRTFRRKWREMTLAWVLSYRLPKREILRTYLSTAYFGYGLRGCDVASRLVYSTESPALDDEKAAFVASMLVYPMPRAVRIYAEEKLLHPISDHREYFNEVSKIAPRWSRRMRRRIAFGLALRRKPK